MVSSSPPPLREGYVFAASGTSLIDAPADFVWSTILEFQSYKHWNPFIRNQVVTDPRKISLPDQTLRVGGHVYIYPVHLPPTLNDDSVGIFNKSSAFCVVTALDHEEFKVAWCTFGIPGWILWTERWQWLTEVDVNLGDGKGGRQITRYDSIEVFGGLAAHLVKWFVGGKLNMGFQAQADGLKGWTENKIRQRSV